MFCEYFNLSGDIINNINDISNQLNIKDIIESLTNLLVAFVGVYGIRYLNKLKEKNNNAVFGFYSRLNVRLHSLYNIFSEFKDEVLDRFLPEDDRTDIPLDKIGSVTRAINKLIQNSKETLNFLKTAEDQMPSSINWHSYYSVLLEFLEDCERLEYDKYFKWSDDYKKNKDEYYEKHEKNLKLMIDDICNRQAELEAKIYKENIFLNLKNKIFKKNK